MTTDVLVKNLATNQKPIRVGTVIGGEIQSNQVLFPGERTTLYVYDGCGISIEEQELGVNVPEGEGGGTEPNLEDPVLPSQFFDLYEIAKACHESNREYCLSIGDDSQPEWDEAPAWQKESAINGVKFAIDNPDITPEESHLNWLAQKQAEGWVYGPEKNPEAKTHPCMVEYVQLPEAQREKDRIFLETVKACQVEQAAVSA